VTPNLTPSLTPRQWVRVNLASSPLNVALTLVFGLVGAWVVYRLGRWLFVTTDWAIVRSNLRLFMVGRFPEDQLWRLWASCYVLAAVLGVAGGILVRTDGGTEGEDDAERDTGPWGLLHRFWPLVLAGVVALSFTRTILPAVLTAGLVAVLVGGRLVGARVPAGWRRWTWPAVVLGFVVSLQIVTFGPGGVGWDDWGGLHLAVVATVTGIALAFPFGIVLALGRRSSLPGVRAVSVCYIEVFRAVPLVALLFVGQYMIGFLFPTTVDPPSNLVRAVIAITLFEAAYIAEIVRGGLQAVPIGQVEAAQAIGLSHGKVLRLVVLPQALRAVIPAVVGQFISLFKDTSLLSIIGVLEILRVSEIAIRQDAFRGQGLQAVALAFAGLVYWAGCSTMARESRRLERRLGVGRR
jgi:general L-amino acid transport system permease protein